MGVLLGLRDAQLGLAVGGQPLAQNILQLDGRVGTSTLGMVASYSAMQT